MEAVAPKGLAGALRAVGPGVVVAATGVGAGDLVAAAKAGALHGTTVLWAVALGAVLKLVLAEGLARYQLATGRPILAAWVRDLGPVVRYGFLAYLLLWSLFVGAALMSACGLAASALFGGLSVSAWGAVHGLLGLAFVLLGGYRLLERSMKVAIAAMFVAICGAAALSRPDPSVIVEGLLVPRLPPGSLVLLLGVVGGVGGTVTLLSYSYWIEERGWRGRSFLRTARVDLAVGYGLTGLFGLALVVLAARHLLPRGVEVVGSEAALQLAGMLGEAHGRAGELVFLVGFWAAVATSLAGVWQGVPYLFAHYVGLWRGPGGDVPVDTRSPAYRGFAVFLTVPPMLLFAVERPVGLVVVYAALGALFMPFLAGSLLLLGRRARLGGLGYGPVGVSVLVLCLALFTWLGVVEVLRRSG